MILTPPKSPNENGKLTPGQAINICDFDTSNCLDTASTVAGVNSPKIKI